MQNIGIESFSITLHTSSNQLDLKFGFKESICCLHKNLMTGKVLVEAKNYLCIIRVADILKFQYDVQ